MFKQVAFFFQRYYRSMLIRRKISLSFFLIMTLFLLVTVIIVYQVSAKILINKSVGNTLQNIRLINNNIDNVLDEVERYTDAAITNDTVQRLLSSKAGSDQLSAYSTDVQMTGALDSVVSVNTLVEFITVLSLDERVYNSGKVQNFAPGSVRDYDWLIARSVRERKQWLDTHQSEYTIKERQQDVLTYAECFYYAYTGELLGVVLANVNETVLSDIYKQVQLGDTGQIFIVNRDGLVVSSRDKQMLYRFEANEAYFSQLTQSEGWKIFKKNDVDNLLVYKKYPKTGWIIVGLVPIAEITGETKKLINTVLLVLSLSILLSGVAVNKISASIAKPVVSLKETVEEAAAGDLETQAQIIGNDEVGMLAASFNDMIRRTSALMDSLVEEQKKKRRYALSLLQAQMNPHFLYNTLENICGLATLNRNEDIIQLVNMLAQFYRSMLSSGNMVVSIGDDLKIAKMYLDILAFTQQKPLEYSFDVEEEILSQPTVKLVMQPLVENAIKHGTRNKEGQGKIHVRGYREEDKIILTITDNGIGIKPEALPILLQKSQEQDARKSFALRGTNERIKMYFGEDCGLSIASEYGVGTTVTIRLSPKADWSADDTSIGNR